MPMKNGCLILIDIWPLRLDQIEELGSAYSAFLGARENIARAVRAATSHLMPIYLQNNGVGIPDVPISLRVALEFSSIVIAPKVFVPEGHFVEMNTKEVILNTARPSDYKNLFYAGFALDACVGNRHPYGYRVIKSKHNKFLLWDAGVVQYKLYNGPELDRWPEYSKVMKARLAKQPLPWETWEDLAEESKVFCTQYASKYCQPISTDEFEEMLS